MRKKTGKKSGILGKILLVLLLLGAVGAVFGGDDKGGSNSGTRQETTTVNKVTVIDFSTMNHDEIEAWAAENNLKIRFDKAYSDTVADGEFISQSAEVDSEVKEGSTIKVIYSLGKEPSTEYKNALKKAQSYSDMMHMSREGLLNQLTSEYGEGFSKDAALWALDHLEVDYNYNALKKAESYSDTMYMSKEGIYDQLVSPYGENFTKEQARYAVDNLETDYNRNALMKAKSYESSLNMSKKQIYEQLTSSYGEQFTADQAQYAIDHLDD